MGTRMDAKIMFRSSDTEQTVAFFIFTYNPFTLTWIIVNDFQVEFFSFNHRKQWKLSVCKKDINQVRVNALYLKHFLAFEVCHFSSSDILFIFPCLILPSSCLFFGSIIWKYPISHIRLSFIDTVKYSSTELADSIESSEVDRSVSKTLSYRFLFSIGSSR